jgi:uncharacterized protein (DUF302 family)
MTHEKVTSSVGYERQLEAPFPQVLERARKALQAEGFGVLCEIDVRAKMKEKLGVDFRNYIILGACNPPLAYEALQRDLNVGLLLPCNVVVYEEAGRTVVAAIDAQKMLSVLDNAALASAAGLVNEKLRRAVDAL